MTKEPSASLEFGAPSLRDPWCRWTWLLGLGALTIRVIVIAVRPLTLRNDSADYQRLAVSLATGHGFGHSHFAPGGGPTALRPPLFPLVLGGLYKAVGVHLMAARLVEAVFGALTVVLLVVISWLLWGRAVGLTAGAVAAVLPAQIMAATSLMSESIALPLELLAILFTLVYRRCGRPRWAVAAGGALGLEALTRPSLAVLVVPLVLLLWERRPSRRQLGGGGALVLTASLVVTPWLLRDRVVMGSWVPVTTQSGFVLSGTYNATSANDPRQQAAWRPANRDPAIGALLASHPNANEVRTNVLLQSAALHYLGQHPTYLGTVMSTNTLRLFDLDGLGEVRTATFSEYNFGSNWGTAEAASGIALFLLAVAGVAIPQGRQVPNALFAAPVLLWLSTVALQAVPRFRAVIDPFLIPLAAVTVTAAVGALRGAIQRPLGAS